MNQIYDRGYKKLFSNKALFRQLLETFVPLDWVKELDFEQCELLDKTFLSKGYRKRESDVIYKVQLRGKTAYIVILLEFQSRPDRFMALRLLHYIVNFYMRLKDTEKKIRRLPPVFPIVIYGGRRKWTSPTDLAELIENHKLLDNFALHFNYFKIAENEIPVERLLEIGNVVSTLFLGEVHYDRDLLIQALSQLPNREERQLVSMLFNFYEQLFNHNKISEVDWNALDKVRTDEENEMLLQNLKLWDKKAYLKGKLEGKEEGKLEGKLEGKEEGILVGKLEGKYEGKLETAKKMLMEGLSIALIAKVTGLTITEIEQLRH